MRPEDQIRQHQNNSGNDNPVALHTEPFDNRKGHLLPILTGLPCRDKPSDETEWCLTHRTDGFELLRIQTTGLGVIDARNTIAKRMLVSSNDRNQLCVWIDSDSFWECGTISKLVIALQTLPMLSTVSAYSGPRYEFGPPLAHKYVKGWASPARGVDPELCPVARCGMQFTVHRLGLLQALPPNPFDFRNDLEFDYPSEDYMFFEKVREVGGQPYMLTTAPVAHIDEVTGLAYLPDSAAFNIVDHELAPYEPPIYENFEDYAAANGIDFEVRGDDVLMIGPDKPIRKY